MAYLTIDKETFYYVKEDFGNLVFSISDEDDSNFEFSFSPDQLITFQEIENEIEYKQGQNQYDLLTRVAERKIDQLNQILNEKNIDSRNRNNLLYLVLNIKAGLDITPQFFAVDNIHKATISNLFTAKLISRKSIDEIEIIIKSSDGTRATFNNLNWSDSLLDKLIQNITNSTRLEFYAPELFDLLNNQNTSDEKLKSIARSHDKKFVTHRKFLALKAASILIKFLNDRNLLTSSRAKLGSNKQIGLIYDMFEVLGLVTPKLEVVGDHIKKYREKIRDNLYK